MSAKTKRTPFPAPRMNFRPTTENPKWEQRGTKPTTSPTSIKEILTLMVLHVCKKSIFFDTNIKVSIYLGSLFLVSLIADFAPIPKTYMSRSDNIFNYYFVKYAWGWNLSLLLPFVYFTTMVYCCANKDKIVKAHFTRILFATISWFFWTKLFNVIEATFGKCNTRGDLYGTKIECLKSGRFWNGFDLSGHSFILIYGSLVLIEETRVIMNWESIRELIRSEEHFRTIKDTAISTNPLRNLSELQFRLLKKYYNKYTPYIRLLFIAITLIQILWDVMLVCTMLYYHIMIEKFLGGAIAILTWFFTYKFWFKLPKILPSMPGDGVFKYSKDKQVQQSIPLSRKRASSVVNGNQVPKFMGMPLYGLRTDISANESQPEETPR